ncbi:MAG: hypothetical protein ACE5ES_02265 [Candidatus Nanoarchaeia archaeon]
MSNDLVRRCCVCKTIEMDGTLIPIGDYSPEDIVAKGRNFTDTFLSKACFKSFYGGDPGFPAELLRPDKLRGKYDTCIPIES